MTKRLFLPIILVIIATALVLFRTGDGCALIGDTLVSGDEVAGYTRETDDRDSSTATITITMKTPPLPDE